MNAAVNRQCTKKDTKQKKHLILLRFPYLNYYYHHHPQMRGGNIFSHICLSVCNALTFESLDLESYAGTSSESSGQACIARSSGQGQVTGAKTFSVFHSS